ncbi:hypothetical protein E4U32_006869 [Claviceps aff. humidiphila group G2b]|nr:hypothetical protein E4U32_006869 [Claviceps aff. humidiphila group G2b]
MLASLPSSYSGLRRSVNQNLCEILQLHEELLSEVGRAIFQSNDEEVSQSCSSAAHANPVLVKQQWVQGGQLSCLDTESAAHLDNPPGLCAGPQIVAEVSRVFEKKV